MTLPFTEEQLKNKFKGFDTNKDGRLSRKELQDAFNSLPAGEPVTHSAMLTEMEMDTSTRTIELDYLVKYAARLGCTVKYST
ncbi:Calcium-binding EF-hand [Corchorus capsularis]|uniref:Calcium-binding EF-hand n=1 Tax=Corchorus capsularis TaxID=210143 RepID=A0A1R3I8N0_COCAP|nr:Calcium-binding EF-hand [Corchorus capsularis]